MGFSTYTKLYESCVLPVINYCTGVWGYKNYNKFDQVQQRALRVFLGVHKYAPIAAIYGDTAWLKPKYHRWIEIIRLWNRLLNFSVNRLTKKIFENDYNLALQNNKNWCSEVKAILSSINKENFFNEKVKLNLTELKNLLVEKQKQDWVTEINRKPKLRFYRTFKTTFSLEKYVSYNLNSSERSLTAQLRMGILPLAIETGRFNNTKAEERLCNICNNGETEDEWHFIFRCETYENERQLFFNEITLKTPDFIYLTEENQMDHLFNNEQRAMSKYVKRCFDKRKCVLYSK